MIIKVNPRDLAYFFGEIKTDENIIVTEISIKNLIIKANYYTLDNIVSIYIKHFIFCKMIP